MLKFKFAKSTNPQGYNDSTKVRDFAWGYLRPSVMGIDLKYSKWIHILNKAEMEFLKELIQI